MENIFENYLEIAVEKKEVEDALTKGDIPMPREGLKLSSLNILAIILNPAYPGVGPFPPIVSDELWIKAVSLCIDRLGPELALKAMLNIMRQTFK